MSLPASANIVEVVSRTVVLESDGDNFIGACPFCTETLFVVSPERKIYYCFGCHTGGNADEFQRRFPVPSMPQIVRDELNKLAERKRRSFRLVK